MKQINTVKEKLEKFVKDHADDLEKAKDAFSKKNWESFCKSIQPVLNKAEELGMIAKGNVEKAYHHTKKETADFYVKASHFAEDTKKLYKDNSEIIEKTCNNDAKLFFSDLKKFSTTAFKDTKMMAQEIAHEAQKHGKPFIEKIKDSGKDLYDNIRKRK